MILCNLFKLAEAKLTRIVLATTAIQLDHMWIVKTNHSLENITFANKSHWKLSQAQMHTHTHTVTGTAAAYGISCLITNPAHLETHSRRNRASSIAAPAPPQPLSCLAACVCVCASVCVGSTAAFDADSDPIPVIDVHNFAHLHTQPKRSVTQQQQRRCERGLRAWAWAREGEDKLKPAKWFSFQLFIDWFAICNRPKAAHLHISIDFPDDWWTQAAGDGWGGKRGRKASAVGVPDVGGRTCVCVCGCRLCSWFCGVAHI